MKIGIYAGTFDPFHRGHLEFSTSALETCYLERVVIVAEKMPYRKKPNASWDHRQAMIERATTDVMGVDHDYAFASALAHEHTMEDMLTAAKKHFGQGNEYWFLVGSDMFEHMHQWHRLVQKSDYGGFVVALRDDHTEQWLTQKRIQMHAVGFDPEVVILDSPRPHVSSSKIRGLISENQKPQELTESVYKYITEHHLY